MLIERQGGKTKCAPFPSGKALRSKDDARYNDMKNFQRIMRSEWEYRESCIFF